MSNRTLQRIAGAALSGLLVIAALVAPVAALARRRRPAHGRQPTDAQPTEGQPTDGLDDGFDGEVVYDPYFISPEPDATADVSSLRAVLRTTSRPQLTPPATDAAGIRSGRQGGAGVPLLLGALAALSITVLALGRVPAVRRR